MTPSPSMTSSATTVTGTGPLLVVAAMREELAGFSGPPPRRGRSRAQAIAETAAVLAVTGDGASAARAGIEPLLDALRPRGVLIVGVSGGLSSSHGIGDVLCARRVVDERGRTHTANAHWLDIAERALATTPVTLLTSARILVSPAAKTAAHASGDRPVAVDLETAVYAEAAQRRGLPWLALRMICDPVDEALPLDFERCRGSDGRVAHRRVVLALLRRPRALGALLTLRRRVRTAARALASHVEALLHEGLP